MLSTPWAANMKGEFRFGTCTVKQGKKGPWSIERFRVTPAQAKRFNLGVLMGRGSGLELIDPGRYVRLRHASRGVVMSNTPFEQRTCFEAYHHATGRVLVNGLGIGMVLEGMLSKPDVTYIRVIEIDKDVIDLVGAHYTKDKRVEIVHADALEYRPLVGEKFDYVWHDIWDTYGNDDDAPQMATLGRRYNKRIAARSGFWGRDWMRAEKRRYG